MKKSKYQQYFHCFMAFRVGPCAFWFSFLQIIVTILISAVFRDAALIRREMLISMYIPGGTALIRGRCSFHARQLCQRKYGNGDKNNNLSLDEYLNKIKLYLRNIITDLQSSGTWRIQLTTAINSISSKDTEEERAMHSASDNIKFTPHNDANEVANELFESLR